MNKQELIGKIKSADTTYLSLTPFIKKKLILDLVKQLDEPQKVQVPKFVADWYEKHKDDFETKLFRAVDLIPSDYEEDELSEFEEWLVDEHTAPFQTLVNMHQFGYEVEKEPKYTVKFKATKQYLSNDELGPHFDPSFRSNFTKSDLEKLGLGWVFDCEGMEVEKVGK